MNKEFTEQEKANIDALDELGVWCQRQEDGWWECENYTPAGGDMCWQLEELTKECLQEYIDNFDINEEVVLWWQPGSNNTPFANIKQHYEDVEEWLNDLQYICDELPY